MGLTREVQVQQVVRHTALRGKNKGRWVSIYRVYSNPPDIYTYIYIYISM